MKCGSPSAGLLTDRLQINRSKENRQRRYRKDEVFPGKEYPEQRSNNESAAGETPQNVHDHLPTERYLFCWELR